MRLHQEKCREPQVRAVGCVKKEQEEMVSSQSQLRPSACGGPGGIGATPLLPGAALCELATAVPILQPQKHRECVGSSGQLR